MWRGALRGRTRRTSLLRSSSRSRNDSSTVGAAAGCARQRGILVLTLALLAGRTRASAPTRAKSAGRQVRLLISGFMPESPYSWVCGGGVQFPYTGNPKLQFARHGLAALLRAA